MRQYIWFLISVLLFVCLVTWITYQVYGAWIGWINGFDIAIRALS